MCSYGGRIRTYTFVYQRHADLPLAYSTMYLVVRARLEPAVTRVKVWRVANFTTAQCANKKTASLVWLAVSQITNEEAEELTPRLASVTRQHAARLTLLGLLLLLLLLESGVHDVWAFTCFI